MIRLMREHSKATRYNLVRLFDLAMAAISLPLSVVLRSGVDGLLASSPSLFYALPLFVAVCAGVFTSVGVSRALWRLTAASDVVRIIKGASLAIPLFLALLFLVDRLNGVARLAPLIQWLVLIVLLVGPRVLWVHWRNVKASVPEAAWQPVLLVGAGRPASLFIETLRWQRRPTVEVVGILDNRPTFKGRAVHHVPVLGHFRNLEEVVARLTIRGLRPSALVLATSCSKHDVDAFEELRYTATHLGLSMWDADELTRRFNLMTAETGKYPDPSTPITVCQSDLPVAKRVVDIIGAALLILLFLPLAGLIAALVWLDLGFPVIFRQIRPGRDSRRFALYKFRTLREGYHNGFPESDQERQTQFGNFLRRTRLDELPQLFNVLRGDMSLVGPRPLMPGDLPKRDELVRKRLAAPPGITGWAQVSGGNLLSPEEKAALDLWYIENYSLRRDLTIMALTLQVVLFGDKINHAVLGQALRRADLSVYQPAV